MAARFDALTTSRDAIVASVVRALYERHPEWETRWGPAGRESCSRDVGFTLSFTEAALRSGDPTILHDYGRWLAGLLLSRGVPTTSAKDSFDLLADALADRLPHEEADEASRALRVAREALDAHTFAASGTAHLSGRALDLLNALLVADRAAVTRILEEAREAGLGVAQIADAVVQPAMAEVGARWARNEISVAEEHRATALAQSALARLFPGATAQEGGGRAVLACVEGNLHSLGLRIFADALEDAGWSVEHLGADVPTRDLLAFLRKHEVDLVGLSVSLPLHLETAQRVVSALRRELGDACPRIVVGGIPMRGSAKGADYIAADAVFADAASGIADLR